MSNSTTFTTIMQTVLKEDEVKEIVKSTGYLDTGRKFTVYMLFQFLANAAFGKWSGYRAGVDIAASCGLPTVDRTTFSKKASSVPFDIFKRMFDLLISKCNRKTRRKLQLPSDLLLIHSTTVTVGKARLPWATYHGERSGVKLHVAFDATLEIPVQFRETIGTVHDGPIGEKLAHSNYILVQDRAYSKVSRFDEYSQRAQFFVTRIKNNLELTDSIASAFEENSNITCDITCKLGSVNCRSKKRFRVVSFQDTNGNEIRVATNLYGTPAEEIAEMYKARWAVESFFRWIKQNLNVPTLFGTTQNAVYNQLFTALITYVVIKWIYESAKPLVLPCKSLSIKRFVRLLLLRDLPLEWKLALLSCLEKYQVNKIPIFG
ncbi:IS4 family transposase [Hazenella sp. IB182357]|uniref:IS4 family transposase n=1 Tax=Polycladospora coralii TaxID=2771432 RepID=A0A926N9E1_9BACL|nr:IS4 family transposase [Polycladospora coralii]MBD1372158.1 IS4 family transposase [Polycladospora coralii]